MSDALIAIAAPWASLYANSVAVRTLLLFGHIGGLVLSGGCAIVMNRAVLAAVGLNAYDRSVVLERMKSVHRTVIAGLVVVSVSGVLLFAADIEAHFVSLVFWTKMTAVSGLAANGLILLRAFESAARGNEHAWPTLCSCASMSLTLWVIATFLGAVLPSV